MNSVLITGGSGSFGTAFTRHLLAHSLAERIAILSRGEMAQERMAREQQDKRLRFFIGDVRDRDRLRRAFEGVEVVIHAAALKQVVSCEYNTFETIETNIFGATNIVKSAVDAGVHKVMGISTDKACQPVTLYGASKLTLERIFVHGNAYTKGAPTLSCVRYGNVIGSRGSVVQVFRDQSKIGNLTVTNPKATRFWITMDQAVEFVLSSIEMMEGGEIFVPILPACDVGTLAKAIAPNADWSVTGLRMGEKLHEMLISPDEMRSAMRLGDRFIIRPGHELGGVMEAYGSNSAGVEQLSVDKVRALL